MSETVILSKTSSRQRPPQPTTGAATAADTTIPSLGGNTMVVGGSESVGRLEKLASKGKASSAASLARVKELVHRDNSRLVKDLMALLAIREATKEVVALPPTPPPPPPPPPPPSSAPQSNSDEGAERRRRKPEQKNRPGDDDTATAALHDDGAAGEAAGTKAAATAAAVASLLHRTATKQFSSLAGEIIAIADDDDADDGPEHEDDRPTARSSNANEAAAADEIRGTGNDGAMMLHADAAAAPTTDRSTTNERPTDDEEREELEKLFPERSEQDAEKDEVFPAGRWWCDQQHSGATKTETARDDGSKLPQRPKVGCFLSGPVSPAEGACLVRTAGAGTPIPPDLGLGAAVQQQHHHPPAVSLTLEQKLDKLLDSVVKIKADMHRRIDRLGKRVEQIHLDVQLNIDSTDRALLRNDLLLIGIPHREREDLQACFRAVCRALEYGEQDIPQVDIRRQRVTGGSSNRHHPPPKPGGGGRTGEPCAPPPAPIVVEFMFKTMRDQFYRAYQAKRVLRLSDLGFASERRFFVNEVLTKYNQKLMAEAVRRKRLGLLHSVYTVDGIVYVQRVAGEKGTKVTSFSSMN
ncbi:AGAP005919-PA [Anopheles gambiae str. PEST]|uniref:AGAP005919-PA n=1 Tax=Anopheles gambiae TaxID=7165 RepID=A7UTY4_ANOGA|nr:AGAP005919-PA [Anopheles gambiae str. PEST]